MFSITMTGLWFSFHHRPSEFCKFYSICHSFHLSLNVFNLFSFFIQRMRKPRCPVPCNVPPPTYRPKILPCTLPSSTFIVAAAPRWMNADSVGLPRSVGDGADDSFVSDTGLNGVGERDLGCASFFFALFLAPFFCKLFFVFCKFFLASCFSRVIFASRILLCRAFW